MFAIMINNITIFFTVVSQILSYYYILFLNFKTIKTRPCP
ncbi:hypothetical protein BBU118A_0574 [Borreliella burgdorferi 118a]|uniref:Uncharacterized protein n=1 Tax=Borreliella burgdorferi 118a TaxID=476210 RepID=A0A7U8I6A9_BORBG|nr:hypothetical protein BBU118A_0574 [Borreliella burgdorferi 118a]